MTSEPAKTENEVKEVRGYCALCTAHCATVATVVNGRVTRLEPDYDHPSGGAICIKGKAAPELVYHPERLDYPLKRTRPKGDRDPGWQRVGWDEALDDIAQTLLSIRERYGAQSIALAKGTGSGTSVDDAERWLGRFLYGFGSPNWVSTTHVCNWHRDTGFSYTFGMNLPTPDLANSKAFLLWGHNPSSTSLLLAHDIIAARARGMKTVVVDPRRVGIGAKADMLLQARPGTDGALALALIHCLMEESWYDAAFARRWTNGPFLLNSETGSAVTEADLSADGNPGRFAVWDEETDRAAIYDPATGAYERHGVRPALFGEKTLQGKDGATLRCKPAFERLVEIASAYAPEKSQKITWVPADKVWQTALLLAHNRPVSMYMWNGLGQHTNATQTSRAIASLYALLGDIDRFGGNVVFPKARVDDVGGKEFLPKETAALRIGRERKPLGPPAKPGNCTAYDIYTAILEGRPYPIKALLNFGSNTILSTGDSRRGREAHCALDFAVATDFFMTPTAALCDYVLPATSFLEMSNLTTNFKHRPQSSAHLQYRPAAVIPLGERHSDTWIIFELAKRTGLGERFWNGDIEAGYAHELAPTGLTLEQLKNSPGGISLGAKTVFEKYARSDDKGIFRGFATPSKKVELYCSTFAAHGYPALPEYVEPALSPLSRPDIAADFPLVLTNAKFTTYVHSQQRALPSLRKASPEPTADIHPDSAALYGIENKQWMIVESPRGAIKVKAHVTKNILPGVVCCQHGWWQACKELELPGYNPYDGDGANPATLIGVDLTDPVSGSLPHRSYLCRVRPANSASIGTDGGSLD
ncbi:MAG: molybdopterin-dependent oxidoreductase [Deltaproteobacteria bacterium]|nr:molybdopterin-dependent oxidoreductase [Deltaproteobacteria bacterium]MDZ4345230.1 molybdopterin-dependent oxidoreductase [Candidatus Binatia bacterium]